MEASDQLAEYYVRTPRQSANLAGRDGIHGTVDAILNELRVQATVDKDGDWRLETDVGPFLLVVDKVNGDVVTIQTIQKIEGKKLKNWADTMYVLLQLNLEAMGARFAGLKDGDTDLLILTSRLKPDDVSRTTLETMLRDCMRLSRTIDELVGGGESSNAVPAPAAGNPQAKADWYQDPKGEARLRYWDGSQWTDHTAA